MEHESYHDKLNRLDWEREWKWDFAYYGPCEECGSEITYRTIDYVLVCKICGHEEYIG